jgi:hypothetical protein
MPVNPVEEPSSAAVVQDEPEDGAVVRNSVDPSFVSLCAARAGKGNGFPGDELAPVGDNGPTVAVLGGAVQLVG